MRLLYTVILSLISFTMLTSQNKFDYAQSWVKIDKLLNKDRLPKSAQKEVEMLYLQAQKEPNYPQLVKAITYKFNLQFQTADKDESEKQQLITEIKQVIATLPFPANALVQSQLAQVYWEHYSNYQWQYLNRTTTSSVVLDDIETWDLATIHKEIIAAYSRSLVRAADLQKIPISDYQDCLLGKPNSLDVRPTLYDLLVGRAIDAFSGINQASGLGQETFNVNQSEFFTDAQAFSRIKLSQTDTLSLPYQTLRMYQQWLTFRLANGQASALLDTDLNRLNYLYQTSGVAHKEQLYEAALERLTKTITPDVALVYYKLALFNYETYQSATKKNPEKLKKAVDYCELILSKYPKSPVAQKEYYADYLLLNIKGAEITLNTEEVYLPQSPILVSLSFRNVKNVKISVFKLAIQGIRNWEEVQRNNSNVKRSLVSQKNILLPLFTDYQNHQTDIALEGLLPGVYIMEMACDKANVQKVFQISDLGAVTVDGELNAYNRSTGVRLADLEVKLLIYDEQSKTKITSLRTNKEGQLMLDQKGYRRCIALVKGSDTLYIKEQFPYQYNEDKEDKQIHTHAQFFTDRAIYRPGQTVYYKALYLQQQGNLSKIKPNERLEVSFRDVNNREVGKQSIVTNEYGSANGSFTIPMGLLNGNMHLECAEGAIYFQVEEYKRPSFEVLLNKPTEEVALNSAVKITGKATALAGYAVDGAKVQYRVVRESASRFPFYRWYYSIPEPSREIVSGTCVSDASGAFQIDFTALVDDVKNDQLIYTYTVTADITDTNGETQSTSLNVRAALNPLVVECNLPAWMDLDTQYSFPIKTTNLDGTMVSSKVQISIDQLMLPYGITRARLGKQSDTAIMTRDEFKKLFPLELYYTESNDPSTFAVGKQIYKGEVLPNVPKDNPLNFKLMGNMASGWYRVTLTATTPKGISTTSTQYVQIDSGAQGFLSKESKGSITQMEEWYRPLKTKALAIGDQATFDLAGGENSVVYYTLYDSKGAELERRSIVVSPRRRLFSIDIKDGYEAGVTARFEMVYQNRYYSESSNIEVPYQNKRLQINFRTFRDKLQPGEHEKWQLVITDENKTPQVAELLATLYDASLEVFVKHGWDNLMPFTNPCNYPYFRATAYNFNRLESASHYNRYNYPSSYVQTYFYLNHFSLEQLRIRGSSSLYGARGANMDMLMESASMDWMSQEQERGFAPAPATKQSADATNQTKKEVVAGSSNATPPAIATRKNFNETVFFYPALRTNALGETIIEFTIPEALTRWKMLGLAHTQGLKVGTIEQELITQKEVAISANAPRFFREGDTFVFTAKVNNVSETDLNGIAYLQLLDAVTGQSVPQILQADSKQLFTVKTGQSTVVQWKLAIPVGVQAITYRVTAEANQHSDGEEKTIPVLTNSMLVTESMPFMVRGGEAKDFTFNRLKNLSSSTIRNHSVTLEFTSNPAWYAVQALPYLMEYPYECAEQTFARYFANSLSLKVTQSAPKIQQIFELWRNLPDSKALGSQLEKNQELKQALLEETPWVLQSDNENERKKRLGLLFDLNKMGAEQTRAFDKLQKAQMPSGAFAWFSGLKEDRYMTQHIIGGLAQLAHLKAIDVDKDEAVAVMVQSGLAYLDKAIATDYADLLDTHGVKMGDMHIQAMQLHYLYTCSFYKHQPGRAKELNAYRYYLDQAYQYWASQSIYNQGLTALIAHRSGNVKVAQAIVQSLKERAKQSAEMGMYWSENQSGYWWYQAPIETQALLIEVFHEVAQDAQSVEELKLYLLRNKQTNDWKTTKATSLACYALLMTGDDLIAETQPLAIKIDGTDLAKATTQDIRPEPGTGYVKVNWSGNDVQKSMADIRVANPNKGAAWGAMYWQYFEQLDKITAAETKLKMNKSLFVKTITPNGAVLTPLKEVSVKVGDVVTVRMELRADRDYEYVHLKDGRASGLEPTSVLSGYRYQDGLRYYQSTKDASTNFFFSYLSKGVYVFEYDFRVTHQGDFSNGISTFQCMYAPEYSAHSEGVRVKVE